MRRTFHQFKSHPLPLTSLIPHPDLEQTPTVLRILPLQYPSDTHRYPKLSTYQQSNPNQTYHHLFGLTPNETAQLVKYWIDRLTQEKETYIASIEPSPYDLLPYEAKLSIALSRIEEQKDLDLEYQIAFNNLVRSHAETRRQRYLERMNPPTPFLTTANSGSLIANVPSANPSRLVPNYANKDTVPATTVI
ncbi:hypothetical protein PCANC_28406 [Puccinia coronata f. sp. avenae]|uniref:Uncharacterized protein n=1 Tax=Puccinia coronata f. sp. avenae TaxID=200324 RepID=A0A2N5TKD2_9BASI|nr:hypothetical protein PCANC_28406 [Puccinia coronata f. sp. avenae]